MTEKNIIIKQYNCSSHPPDPGMMQVAYILWLQC